MKKYAWSSLALAAALMLNANVYAKSAPKHEAAADENTTERVTVADLQDELDAYKDELNTALGTLAAKTNDMDKQLGLKFSGDVRLRYALYTQTQSDTSTATQQLTTGGSKQNTIFDKSIGRYRVRFGASKQMGDFTGTFRLASGAPTGPNSENNTFDAAFANPTIDIDTAMITYVPSCLEGHVKLQAGKMPNPLTKTSITWDPDIQPEGVLLELSQADTKLRATYFDFNNQATKLYADEIINNIQLEQLFKFNTDTAIGLMVGYEYIPFTQQLINVNWPAGIGTPLSAGNVNDPNNGGGIRDFMVGEAMLTVKHKIGIVPFKWTLHITDNFNGTNLPSHPGSGAVTGYTSFSNQYAEWLGVDMGVIGGKGDWSGTLAVAQLDPNCQMGNLLDDDPGYANRQYAFGSLSYGLEDNVVLKISQWMVYHEYYAYLPLDKSLGGSSQAPESITFVDCIVNL